MISRRGFISALAGGLLAAPVDVHAQGAPKKPLSFARGQWTAHGTNTFQDVIYRDQTGRHIGIIKGATSSSPDTAFIAWASADYDTDRDEFPIILQTGHKAWSSNEVNTFSMATAAWRHDFDPTLDLIPAYAQPTPPPVVGTRPGGVPYYIDAANKYPDHAELDGAGHRSYPNMRQSYGGVVYMPAVQRYFLWGGVVWWDPATPYIPCEYDPVTKKYRNLDKDAGFNVAYGGTPYACWDSRQERVLFHDAQQMFAYYPTRPFGQRVVALNKPGDEPFMDRKYNTMLFDHKRNRAVVTGLDVVSAYRGGVAIYDFSANPMRAVLQDVTKSLKGPTTGFVGVAGPGWRYDPVEDRYVGWNGGKTLYFVNPETWVSTDFTPASGDTPTTSQLGTNPGGGTWQRFFYSRNLDVFGVVSHANEPFYIFAPKRA